MIARSTPAAVALAVVVAATAAAGYYYPQTLGAAQPGQPGQPQQASVTEQAFVCPLLRADADTTETVSVITSPGVAAAGTAGEVRGTAAGTVAMPPPGSGATVAPAADEMTKVVARGGSAGGTATVRSYYDAADEGRGLAVATCEQPQSQWWFVGVTALPGQIDELLLANPTQSPAVVTVDVFGSTGPIDVLGVGGVVVQPGEQSAIRVDSLIPGVAGATMRVTTSGGLVVAAMRSTVIDGLIPQGAEYLPPAMAPAQDLVVPGVLGGPGARDLVITAGDQDAAVELTLLTEAGPRKRSGERLIPVPAGTSVVVGLADDLAGEAAAVSLAASAPVTAAVRSVVAGTLPPDATGVLNRVPSADMAWSAAQAPIAGRWMLPLTGAAEAPGGVLLSAHGGPAEVQLTLVAADGTTEQRSVDVAADKVTRVDLPVTAGVPAVVELAVQQGQVQAAAYQVGASANGPLATVSPGMDPSAQVLLPVAYPDPQVLTD